MYWKLIEPILCAAAWRAWCFYNVWNWGRRRINFLYLWIIFLRIRVLWHSTKYLPSSMVNRKPFSSPWLSPLRWVQQSPNGAIDVRHEYVRQHLKWPVVPNLIQILKISTRFALFRIFQNFWCSDCSLDMGCLDCSICSESSSVRSEQPEQSNSEHVLFGVRWTLPLPESKAVYAR